MRHGLLLANCFELRGFLQGTHAKEEPDPNQDDW